MRIGDCSGYSGSGCEGETDDRVVKTFLAVEWFDRLRSTNTYLRERLVAGTAGPSGTIVAAREQTAGRGRGKREWLGAPGRDLAFSFLLRERTPQTWAPSLAMAAALGIAAGLQSGYGLEARVKWPNDVRVRGRKICGILSERVATAGGVEQTFIVGIGVNVNMPLGVVEAIDPPATSILRETDSESNVEECLDGLLSPIAERIETWRGGGFEALRSEWLEEVDFLGESVRIMGNGRSMEGVLEGFGTDGELLLREGDGERRIVVSGDVHLRGPS